jgi:molybdopterin-guanine dinucleotide biosynthesis protein
MTAKKPFTIGIGGSHSSIGKTTLAAALVGYLSSGGRCRLFANNPKIGAIKYTREENYSSLADDETIPGAKGKDTARFGEAGASRVIWKKSPAADIGEVMPRAMDRMSGLDAVIIEGNSAVEFAKPDIVIFITGGTDEETKPSAERVARLADITIEKSDCSGHSAVATVMKRLPSAVSGEETEVIIRLMEEIAEKKEIVRLLTQRAEEGGITCSAARKIAEELNVPYNKVGGAANELKIRIRACELGCF